MLVRIARDADKTAVVALCNTVWPDDYVPEVLDTMMAEGVLFVAERDNHLVGIMHLNQSLDGQAWLAAARTHPDHRRQGVARALLEAACEVAKRRGASVARLWSSASNVAGNASAHKVGFAEAAAFCRVKAERKAAGYDVHPVDSVAELRGIVDSEVVARGGGLVPVSFAFVRPDLRVLEALAASRNVFRSGRSLFLFDEALWKPWGGGAADVSVLAGDVARALQGAMSLAMARGLESLQAFLPFDDGLLVRARRAGFRPASWGRQAIVFEKALS